MKQDMQTMSDLDGVLQQVLDETNQVNLRPASQCLDEGKGKHGGDHDGLSSIATATEDRLETETILSSTIPDGMDEPIEKDFVGLRGTQDRNNINAVSFDKQQAQKMLPPNFRIAQPMGRAEESDISEDSDENE